MRLASGLPTLGIRLLLPGANVCPRWEVRTMLDKHKGTEATPWAAQIVIELIQLLIVLLCGSGPN